jgi:glyoxylase-like metal-dependent hydrolase (beta-lactamase superfamily II)
MDMDVVEVVPGLHLLRLGIANAYLWHDEDGATLVDTGPPGSGPAITAVLQSLGLRREDVRRVVLTHFHDDHAGSAAEIASWAGAQVVVGRADAPFVRGDAPGPPPAFTAAEQALHAAVAADLEPAPACRVDQEVEDGHVLDVAGGTVVLGVPGHTPGSIALHVREHGVLITGDTVAEHQGQVVLGPFNTDRAGAWASLQRLAAMDVEVACFGHGEPVTAGAGAALRGATDVFA